MFRVRALIIYLSLFVFASCHTSWQTGSVQYQQYRITQGKEGSETLNALVKPYSDSVNKSMNDVLGIADMTLEKEAPEGSLGDFMADAYFVMAKKQFNVPVDGAMMNYGGIRLTQLAAGPVTRGKIFELMPFDNILILQKLKGSVLQQLLDHIANRGGWPVANISFQIKDKKAVNVLIGGQPIDMNKEYTIANSDFVANGGDNAEMLRAVPQINKGYLMRDALIDYVLLLKAQGKNITVPEKNRVSNAQ